MRVVFALGWYFPDSLGGTEVYVEGLCRRLRAAGLDVHIAAPTTHGPPVHEYEHEGVPVVRYRIPENPTRAECQGLAPVRGTERFHGWLRDMSPDVVHLHTFTTGIGPAEVRAARETGARVFVTTHLPNLGYLCQRGTMLRWGESLCDGICQPAKCAACSLHERGMPKPLARVAGLIPGGASQLLGDVPGRPGTLLGMKAQIRRNQHAQASILRDVEKFVVLTQWAYDTLIRNGAPPEKVVLNRLGHGHSSVPRKPPADVAPTQRPIRIGFLGRLDPVKGADVLARAVANLPSEIRFTLELCGPSASGQEDRVGAEIHSILASDSRVVHRGAIPPHQVPETLASFDVLVVPSVCLEGGPTVAIEAHAVGTPVVGSRIGGLAELVRDGIDGQLVPPGDVAALSAVLRSMAVDPVGTIDRWRAVLPPARTMDAIARDHLTLYGGGSPGHLSRVDDTVVGEGRARETLAEDASINPAHEAESSNISPAWFG